MMENKELIKKIAGILIDRNIEKLKNNKNSTEKLIRLSDPFGETAPEVFDPIGNEGNCPLRDLFKAEIDYDFKEVRITKEIDGVHKTFVQYFTIESEINKAVLLCIIKSEEPNL